MVPDEWNVKAYIKYNNKTIIDFDQNNLHLVGYSIPVNKAKFKKPKKKFIILKQPCHPICYLIL